LYKNGTPLLSGGGGYYLNKKLKFKKKLKTGKKQEKKFKNPPITEAYVPNKGKNV
jgi:hypothetical protein